MPATIPTTATLHFSIPAARLDHDVSRYLDPAIGPTWPLEPFEVELADLRAEEATGVVEGLEGRGFAVLKHESAALGGLRESEEWNPAYLNETMELIQTQLGASRVFIWNSVTRSSDPALNAPYEGNHLQKAPIKGLQFGTTIRPTATGAHVDQDAPNSMRMCRLAAGDDVKYARVQQINVWRPLRGPVTTAPLTLCDGRTVDESCKGIHCGFFGSRVTVHHGPEQKWYYLSRMQPDEALLIKIYDSQVREGDAPYAPHSGCDIHGHDGPETPRESIEVRVVAVYDE